MKKVYLIITIVTIYFSSFGQQFSFPIYFQDAIGNKDTIILGYDINGTDAIDAIFGEINIISKPIDTALDVRITDEWSRRRNAIDTGTYHSKKQIIKNNCGTWFSIIGIDIFAKHWPVTASWDSSLFNDTCRNGSVFTSINPGGWWDTGSQSDLGKVVFKNTNHVIFTSNIDHWSIPDFGYVNYAGDSIAFFWQAFGDSTAFQPNNINDINKKEIFQIYPNPLTSSSTLQLSTQLKNAEVVINDVLGKEMMRRKMDGDRMEIMRGSLVSGVYFVKVISEETQLVEKMVVE